MVRKFPRSKRFNPAVKLFAQYLEIKKTYSNIEIAELNKDNFVVTMNVTPSENSQTYKVEISYRYGYKPKAVLLSPELQQRNGQYPHHTYGKDKRGYAKLCVYCPDLNEWDESMSIATSFIPWFRAMKASALSAPCATLTLGLS